jgi:hypothetical protein
LGLDAGDQELFHTLKNILVKSIPVDSVEWRRSYDRPIKIVKLGATFISFSQDILPSENDCHLIKRPIFHTYWSECTVSKQFLFVFTIILLIMNLIFVKGY